MESTTQFALPFLGEGFVHVRARVCVPPQQVTVHGCMNSFERITIEVRPNFRIKVCMKIANSKNGRRLPKWKWAGTRNYKLVLLDLTEALRPGYRIDKGSYAKYSTL